MPRSDFRIFGFEAFHNYLRQTTFQRKITFVQNHHTFKPGYQEFNGNNHMALLEGMRRFHIDKNGWSDIGQNITIFPDGQIGLCRAIDITPAGIFGANTGAICIENLGDFDEQKDVMTAEQKEAIVKTNAALCLKFGLQPQPQQVVYHHWYDRKGKRFSTADIDSGKVLRNDLQKTCPGTNFFRGQGSFKGNTVASAIANFYPPIQDAMNALHQAPTASIQTTLKRVTASVLNVRTGRGIDFPIVRKLSSGVQVAVVETQGDWCRISATGEEWVNAKFLA